MNTSQYKAKLQPKYIHNKRKIPILFSSNLITVLSGLQYFTKQICYPQLLVSTTYMIPGS